MSGSHFQSDKFSLQAQTGLILRGMVRMALFASIFAVFCYSAAAADGLAEGDIIFQRNPSDQSAAIAAATKSEYTHVGLILFDGGQPYVYEAVQPVKRTPLSEWIARGEGGHYVIKRLEAKQWKGRSPDRLEREARKLLGKNYDILFGWSDEEIYCSEYVWKVYQRAFGLELCPLRRLKDFDLSQSSVKKLMAKRYGDAVPYDMEVVAPSDLFNSKLLKVAAQKGAPNAR